MSDGRISYHHCSNPLIYHYHVLLRPIRIQDHGSNQPKFKEMGVPRGQILRDPVQNYYCCQYRQFDEYRTCQS